MLVDRLAPRALLDDLDPSVLVIDVGKTAGHHPLPQEEINRLLVEHAQAGRRVVRLKGGDPFVLGRGGEEALACLAAGVTVEVVPGVTSAIAVPAHAGIPVTHRGRSRQVTIASGHEGLDWASLAALDGTLVLLMGVSGLEVAAAELVAHGKAATTPVAIVESGFSPVRAHHGRHPGHDRRSWPASATCSRRPSSSIGDVVDLHAVLGSARRPPLVAVAHGSRDPAAAEATRSLLAAVRRARPGAGRARGVPRPRVAAAGRASLARAARRTLRRRAAAARRGLPQPGRHPRGPRSRLRAGRCRPRCWGRTRCCSTALERRLAEVGVPPGDPDTAVVLAAAGSADESSVAARARARRDVAVARLVGSVEPPSPPPPSRRSRRRWPTLRAAGAPRVAVATYLLFPGLFADKLADRRRRRHLRAARRRARGRRAGPRALRRRRASRLYRAADPHRLAPATAYRQQATGELAQLGHRRSREPPVPHRELAVQRVSDLWSGQRPAAAPGCVHGRPSCTDVDQAATTAPAKSTAESRSTVDRARRRREPTAGSARLAVDLVRQADGSPTCRSASWRARAVVPPEHGRRRIESGEAGAPRWGTVVGLPARGRLPPAARARAGAEVPDDALDEPAGPGRPSLPGTPRRPAGATAVRVRGGATGPTSAPGCSGSASAGTPAPPGQHLRPGPVAPGRAPPESVTLPV